MKKQKPNNSNNCELYLDHTPVWAGDGFYCSKCMLEFVPKKFISSELQIERERVIKKFAKIVDKSYDKDFGTYDYKQIAEDFISEINSLRKK